MTKKKTMKNIKTPNKFLGGGAFNENFRAGFSKAMNLPDGSGFKDMFSAANLGNALGSALPGMAGALGGVAGGLISDGFSTTGGQVLSGIGDAAMMFNPIIGGAIKAASGLVNRGFGTKWNQEGLAKAESQITGLNNFQSGASDYDTLAQDVTRIGSMNKTIKASDLGEDGWFVNRTTDKANELNTDLGNAYNYAMRNANNVADNIASNTLANLERNYAAFGGPLFAYGGQTHGSDFTNGLMFINNGGTHENNPYEGVPISMDQEGNPNLVEEGEVVWNDYVFSDRLKVPKAVRTKYKLRGPKDMTFADAIEKLSKESEERPNDPISKRGLDNNLLKLAMEQEQLKVNKPKNPNKFDDGGAFNKYGYVPGYNGGWFDENNKYTEDYRNRVNNMTLDQLQAFMDSQYAFYSDPANANSNRWKAIDNFYKANSAYNKEGYVVTDTDLARAKKLALDGKPGYMHYIAQEATRPRVLAEKIETTEPEGLRSTPVLRTTEKGIAPVVGTETITGNDIETLPTWMRYAPVIGHGALALTDAFGLTNKPDYSNAEAIISAAKGIRSNPIRFTPIGDYLAYNPFDTEYHANQLRSVSGATRRNIMNTSGGNRATAMASVLAADNNTMNQMGDLYRKAAEYNLEQKQKVADFNRATNITNSEGFLKSDMANQSAAAQARALGLEGLITGYKMKEQANLMSDQAKSANISGLLTSLGNIGYENVNRNMMNWGMANGTWAPSQWKYDPLTGKKING